VLPWQDLYFGLKLNAGSTRGGLVHHLPTPHAAAADITQVESLLHGEDREIFADQEYWSEAHRKRSKPRA
jgi:IS5 family transposase